MADYVFEGEFSHPVNQDIELEIHYVERIGLAELHRAGCKHRCDRVRPFTGALADDYFPVAPCARAKGGK